jgi:hypothetical protein
VIVGDGDACSDIAGFSILDADSQPALIGMLRDHPHFQTPGGQIEIHELQRPPAM